MIEPRDDSRDRQRPSSGAFDRIWDGSELHAAAVVKVIEALVDLRPFEKQKE